MRNSIVVRWLVLLVTYFVYKIKYWGKVNFKGFTYFYAGKGGKIEFRGKGTIVNNYSVSNAFGLFQRTIFYAPGGHITIGEDCGISGTTFCSMVKITVGNRVQVGANCKIMDNDQHSLDPAERYKDIRDNVGKRPVHIGDDCFIGTGCIILKGTMLGRNCVVGAGSVVHGEFPDNCVIAGNPAKIIKHLENNENLNNNCNI